MCGVGLFLHRVTAATAGQESTAAVASLEEAIAPRGPDQQGNMVLALGNEWSLVLLASVLHMRGPCICSQPAQDASGNVLLWNGEVFAESQGREEDKDRSGIVEDFGGESTLQLMNNDTEKLLQELGGPLDGRVSDLDEGRSDALLPISRHVRRTLAKIKGPWAMIFYHSASNTLHFGRDRLGRRSLVMSKASGRDDEDMDWMAVASTSTPFSRINKGVRERGAREGEQNIWEEVPVDGLRVLDLSFASNGSSLLRRPHLVPWGHPFPLLSGPRLLPMTHSQAMDSLYYLLGEAVRRRVVCVQSPPCAPCPSPGTAAWPVAVLTEEQEQASAGPPAHVGVLYSGGVDCQVLAALTHLQLGSEPEASSPVDLLNVCFDSPGGHRSPDRLAALAGWLELRRTFPTRRWRLILVDVDDYGEEVGSVEEELRRLILPCSTPMDFNIACAFYHAARGVGRVACVEEAARVLEEAAAAGLGGKLLRYGKAAPKEGPREAGGGGREAGSSTGKVKELPGPCTAPGCRRVFKPGCMDRLCHYCCRKRRREAFGAAEGAAKPEVLRGGKEAEGNHRLGGGNVAQRQPLEQGQRCRVHEPGKPSPLPSGETLGRASSPSSLSQGPPLASPSPLSTPLYRSRARALLVGVGADEQLAGYGRHRATFQKGGEAALVAELAMDLGRLWTRWVSKYIHVCISIYIRLSIV